MPNTHVIDLEAGSSQYLSVADNVALSITGDISMEAWVKVESFASNATYTIMSKFTSTGDQRSYIFSYRNPSSVPQLYLNCPSVGAGEAGDEFSENVDLGTGVWHHVAVTVNHTTNEVKFYVDGAQEGSTQTITINSIFDGNAAFMIGALTTTVVTQFFDGLIDEVRVWSDVRTTAEILASYNLELDGDEAGLAGYWKLNNSLLDITANGSNLTNNGAAVFSTDVPFTASEGNVVGSGLGFKDTNRHILMFNASDGGLTAGDVVVLKSTSGGNKITTTTSAGNNKVLGMVVETIASNTFGRVQISGNTTVLKVNGTTDIAIGDYLSTHTVAGIAAKASAGHMVFAIALEAYTTNDSNGVIDAIILPWRTLI